MSKIKTKELIICLISIIFLILTLVTDVFASDLNSLLGDGNNSSLNYSDIPSIDNNTNNKTITNKTITFFKFDIIFLSFFFRYLFSIII